VLRRTASRPNWFRSDRLDGGLHVSTCSDQIARIMDAETFLHAHPLDDDLLAGRFEACSDLWLDHGLRLKDGEWVLESSRVRHTQGFSFPGNADVATLMLLARCDGKAPLVSIVESIRAAMSPVEAPPVEAFVELTRRLVRCGHLVPSER